MVALDLEEEVSTVYPECVRVCKVDVCGVEMECEGGYAVCAVTVVVKCEASVYVYVCMIYNFQQLKTLVYQCSYSNP